LCDPGVVVGVPGLVPPRTPLVSRVPGGMALRAPSQPCLPPCVPEQRRFVAREALVGHSIMFEQVIEDGTVVPLNGCQQRGHRCHSYSSLWVDRMPRALLAFIIALASSRSLGAQHTPLSA